MRKTIILFPVLSLALLCGAGCKFKKKIDMSEVESTEPEYKMGEYAVFPGHDDVAKAIVASADGGFVVAATTRQKNKSYDDIWLIKLDKEGNKQWEKFFPLSGEDMIGAMLRTDDDGTIIAGSTFGKGEGQADAWVIKLDKEGELQWEKTYGGKGMERAQGIGPTKDGGYVVAGYTTSKGEGGRDVWVIKIDKEGKMQWDKTFGGKKKDKAEGPSSSCSCFQIPRQCSDCYLGMTKEDKLLLEDLLHLQGQAHVALDLQLARHERDLAVELARAHVDVILVAHGNGQVRVFVLALGNGELAVLDGRVPLAAAVPRNVELVNSVHSRGHILLERIGHFFEDFFYGCHW